MTTIPTRFSRAGFDYEQVKRNGLNAIFAQKCKGTVIAYEVVQIKVAPPERMFGKDYPEREVYPGNEEWGSIAWSCSMLERALERYSGLEVAA